jgi:hypothetical protein
MLLRCAVLALIVVACGHETPPPAPPRTTEAKAPERPHQTLAPTRAFDSYLDGFHVMKDDHSKVVEAHMFCRNKNEDFAQCAVFDGDGPDANLVGIEYIISERLYQKLPPEEQASWHPHNYEITSGQLVMPGLPGVVEKAALAKKLNSYGKTWRVWDSDHSEMPIGDPELMWSFNHDGETPPQLIERRDARLHVDTQVKREQRKDLVPNARPQQGEQELQSRR